MSPGEQDDLRADDGLPGVQVHRHRERERVLGRPDTRRRAPAGGGLQAPQLRLLLAARAVLWDLDRMDWSEG